MPANKYTIRGLDLVPGCHVKDVNDETRGTGTVSAVMIKGNPASYVYLVRGLDGDNPAGDWYSMARLEEIGKKTCT